MLTEQQIRLYARQVILRELGQAGQARLCASRVTLTPGHTPAALVARDYLQRAGVQVVDDATATAVALAEPAQLEPALRACADWLLGAFSAVETIKQLAGVGTPAAHVPDPWAAEID